VTGAAGFLGARIAAALEAEAEVVRFDRSGGAGVIAGDVARIAEALPRGLVVDAVVHAAAITTQASEADPAAAWAINVEGTRAVIAWCAAQPRPPRLVLLSSIAVLAGGEAEPEEASRVVVASTYGTTKAVAELLVQEAARRGAADGVVLRLPVSVIRTSRYDQPGAGFISDLVLRTRRGLPFTAPLAPGHRLPIGSVEASVGLACRAALAAALPARVLHAPSLAISGEDAVAALEAAGIAARHLVSYAPDPATERLVAGWPRRLATRYPAFSDGIAERDFAAILARLPPP
jgi:nucleoside-diphosphate-sugar epimerase